MAKRRKKSNLTRLKLKLWQVISEYVRLRDSDNKGMVKCCTCDEIRYYKGEYMNAGHFFPRKLSPALMYDVLNIHTQCNVCNGSLEGQQYFMSQYIRNIYGQDTLDYLVSKFRQPFKFTTEWLEAEIKKYKKEVEKLKKAKTLKND